MESPSTIAKTIAVTSPSKSPDMHELCKPSPSPAITSCNVATQKMAPNGLLATASQVDAEIRNHANVETLFPVISSNTFFAGYAHCAQEAIRFLIEEEGLPFSHPLIIGLYDHLSEHQKMLHIRYMLASALDSGQPEETFTECDTTNMTAEEEVDEEIQEEDVDGTIGKASAENTEDAMATSVGNKEQLAEAIARQIFEMLQFDDSAEDEEDVDDEGFEESA